MKVLDLFSGIGGFSLGLDRAGMQTVAFCEIDPHCRKILKKHWPNTPIYEDISKLGFSKFNDEIYYDCHDTKKFLGQETGKIDLICGGFPCQDISTAGAQKGMVDNKKYQKAINEGSTHEEAEREARTRSGLWFEYKRIIREVRPTYVLIENVGNLRGNGLITVLKDLRQLGYDAEWHIISAKSVSPAWHERKRIWIIAVPHGHNFRLCDETLTTKEEKQKWWAKATAKLRAWWPLKPTFRGTVDGVPRKLDLPRQRRIRQLGNAVVPQIPEFIGTRIMEYERNKK